MALTLSESIHDLTEYLDGKSETAKIEKIKARNNQDLLYALSR